MQVPSPAPQADGEIGIMTLSKSVVLGSSPSRPARILLRRCPASIFEQFEFIEKIVDHETVEIVGVKCRLCDEVIMDEAAMREYFAVGALVRPPGMHRAFAGLSFLTVPLLLNGGIHMLLCKRTKMN